MNHTLAAKCNDLGIYFIKYHQLTNAATMFRSAINYKNDYVSAHTNLAFTHIALKEYDAAIPVLQKAISLDPTNFMHHFYIGLSQAETDDLDSAVKSFERSANLKPTFKPTMLRAGLALLLLNQTDAAIEWIKNASDGSLSGSYAQAGLNYLANNETELAKKAINRALRI